jgi:hypothetical protein
VGGETALEIVVEEEVDWVEVEEVGTLVTTDEL